jgi:hypothetical protein
MGVNSSMEEVEEDGEYPFMQHALGKIRNNIPFVRGQSFESPTTQSLASGELLSQYERSTEGSKVTNDSIVNSIISQFAERSMVGCKKYGTTLDRKDLSLLDWVQHAQEEMMDGILYLEKIKRTTIELQNAREKMEKMEKMER